MSQGAFTTGYVRILLLAFIFMIEGTACIQPSGSSPPKSGGGGGVSSSSSSSASNVGELQISDGPSFSYGVLNPGITLDHVFTLTNLGTKSITFIGGTSTSGAFIFPSGYPGAGASCASGSAIAPSATCTVKVRFAPGLPAAYTALITIHYEVGGTRFGAASRFVMGSGSQPAVLASTPASSVWSSLPTGSSSTTTFTIKNNGGMASGTPTVSVTGGPSFTLNTNNCGTAIAVSATCTILVDFTAQAPGAAAGSLRLNYSDGTGATQTLTVNLSGTATRPADHLEILSQPSGSVAVNQNIPLRVQVVDSLGVPTPYYTGAISIAAENMSPEFGAVPSSPAILTGSNATLVNGVATFAALRASAPALIKLVPSVLVTAWPALTTPASNQKSSVVAVDLLRSATSSFYSSGTMLSYLPFDSSFDLAVGAGSASLTPGVGFRHPPWEPPSATTLSAYDRTGAFFNDSALYAKDSSSVADMRYAGATDLIDFTRGTVSFWLRAGFDGSDATTRRLLYVTNAVDVSKFGAPSLKLLGYGVIAAGLSKMNELDIQASITSWTAGSWHYINYRWDSRAPIAQSLGTSYYSALQVDGANYYGRTSPWSVLATMSNYTSSKLHVASAPRSSSEASAGGVVAGFRIDDRAWTDLEAARAYDGGVTSGKAGIANDVDGATEPLNTGNANFVAGTRAFAERAVATVGTMSAMSPLDVTVNDASMFAVNDRVRLVGSPAARFDGASGTYESLAAASATHLDFGLSSFTIEAFVRQAGVAVGTYQTIVTKLSSCGAGGGGYLLAVRNDGILYSQLCAVSGVPVFLTGATAINDNRWHHVALIVDRLIGVGQLYVDGKIDGQSSLFNMGTIDSSAASLYIGGSSGTAYALKGDLDSIRFWDAALTATQLQTGAYSPKICGTTLNLKGKIGFDEAPATVNHLESCSGNSLVLTGGVSRIGSGVMAASTTPFATTWSDQVSAIAANTIALTNGSALLYPESLVYKIDSASADAYNAVTGGDFDESMGSAGATYDAMALKTPSVWRETAAPLSGRASLHVLTSPLCTTTSATCYTGYSGVWFDGSGQTAAPAGYLVSFDYKMLSSSSLRLFLLDAAGALEPGGDLTPNGLTAASMSHFEMAYPAPADGTNKLNFLTGNATGEFLLDNVKVRPAIEVQGFEGGLPAGYTIDASCSGSGSSSGSLKNGGVSGYELTNCSLSTGLKSGVITTGVGEWYTLSAWVLAKASSVRINVIDSTGPDYLASIPVAQGASGNALQRVAVTFQALSAQTTIEIVNDSSSALDFIVDDLAVVKAEALEPTKALAASSTVFSTAGAAADTCSISPFSNAPGDGRMTCGATSAGNWSYALGPGVSCPSASSPLNSQCSTGSTPSAGGTNDGALALDGSTTFTVPIGNANHGAFSVSMWVKLRKPQSGSDYQRDYAPLFGIGTFGAGDSFALWNLPTGLRALICGIALNCPTDPTALSGGGGGARWSMGTETSETSGMLPMRWYHVVATYDDSQRQGFVYQNASTASAGSFSNSDTYNTMLAGVLNFGNVSPNLVYAPTFTVNTGTLANEYSVENLDGWLDNVRTFNRALTADEILGICNTEKGSNGVTCGP